MAEDKIALGETTPEDQERLRQEQEDARERKEADRRAAENEQIESDAGRVYEQAIVMGDDVERSIPPVRSEDDGPERPVDR
jgi:hypothetical protein